MRGELFLSRLARLVDEDDAGCALSGHLEELADEFFGLAHPL
jgi:hypothetical protein